MAFYRAHVLLCTGTPCRLHGADAVKAALTRALVEKGLDQEVRVVETGCLGISEAGPVMVVYPEGTLYCRVTPADIPELVEEHLLKGRPLARLIYKEGMPAAGGPYQQTSYFAPQQKVVLKNCGSIDPLSINEYIANGGYQALAKAVTTMTPAQVVAEVKASGLRGRGGAGFPTGLKWEAAASQPEQTRYLICNADEGEPGNFKDRLVLEGDPHLLLEAMLIAGYAIGAKQGFIYIRGEYHQSVANLIRAIDDATRMGLLGKSILGTGFDFEIRMLRGAGAYICGEEKALIESLEGRRGESAIRPPYPTTQGLWGKPTVINNVETLANVPAIIGNGAAWYQGIGTEKSKGTKIFSPCGDAAIKGVIEVPLGTSIREVLYGIAGGTRSGRPLKAVLVGGPSGPCLGQGDLDRTFAYEDVPPGAGALIVADDSRCIVDLIRSCFRFFNDESCGQCTPCREGVKRMYEGATRMTRGLATAKDLQDMEELAAVMARASLCGLGQSATTAFTTSLRLFRDEYLAHTNDKRCPAGVCSMSGE